MLGGRLQSLGGKDKVIHRLSKDEEPVAFTPLGYPADELKPKKRKALSSFVRYF